MRTLLVVPVAITIQVPLHRSRIHRKQHGSSPQLERSEQAFDLTVQPSAIEAEFGDSLEWRQSPWSPNVDIVATHLIDKNLLSNRDVWPPLIDWFVEALAKIRDAFAQRAGNL